MIDNFGLEYHIVDSCNLRCAGCSHYSSLLDNLTYTPLNKILDEMNLLKSRTNDGKSIKWLKLLGGEPLLHPELTECIYMIRNLFPQTRITLVTNGLKLCDMPNLFFDACRISDIEIQVTDYGIINLDKVLNYVRSQNAKIGIYRTCRIWHFQNIRLTNDIVDCFERCYHRKMCPNYKDGKIYLCPQMAYIDIFNSCFKTKITINNNELVDVESISDFNELINKLLLLRPNFCSRYCNCSNLNGNSESTGQRYPTKKNIKEFCKL